MKKIIALSLLALPLSVAADVTVSSADLSQTLPLDLTAGGEWLVITDIRPSAVEKECLPLLTVGGQAAKRNVNVRLAVRGAGTAVIPISDDAPLTVFSNLGCTGDSKTFSGPARATGLGDWDNKIKSFTLKRGYMATFANNADGTGHSRVYIADEADVRVDTLPEGFLTYMGEDGAFVADSTESFVSFIRVLPWSNPGKRGWAGSSAYELHLANVFTHYGWNASPVKDSANDGYYAADHEYVPIKQQPYWPGWDEIYNLNTVTTLLGYNEPDNSNQSNVTVENTIRDWPDMLKAGLRLGSPAPCHARNSWSDAFWKYINLYNYRCDIAVGHIYEYITLNSWKSRINDMVKSSGGRPCWITEYNYGANWTNEKWPDGTRAATEGNLEHERQWMAEVLPGFDAMPKLERTFFYNWVEDCRAVILNKSLTPAGEVFAAHNPLPAYSADNEYQHVWKVAPPYTSFTYRTTAKKCSYTIYDHNAETGTAYIIQMQDLEDWVSIDTLVAGVDYTKGDTKIIKNLGHPDTYSAPRFRILGVGYRGQISEPGPEFASHSEKIDAPKLTISSDYDARSAHLEWDEVPEAEGYAVQRSENTSPDYEIIAIIQENEYVDANLEMDVRYKYTVTAFNKEMLPATSSMKWVRFLSSITDASSAVGMRVGVEGGSLVIESSKDAAIDVVALDGRVVKTVKVVAGTNVVEGLAPGIYVVANTKIVIK